MIDQASATDGTETRERYVLGHSERELARLIKQARLIEPITRRYLMDGGLARGMRVLDVGCGVGDVAFLAADIVGPAGQVVGVDRSPVPLTLARQRARELGLTRVSFTEGDPAEISFGQPFDAVIGRYVLMFQPDPAAMLRRLARHLAPGGRVIFHEPDWDGNRTVPTVDEYERCARLLIKTLMAAGHETHMGAKLYATFLAAGLPAPTLALTALICGSESCRDVIDLLADVRATMLPEMERLGIAESAQVPVEGLAERIHHEVRAKGSVIVGRSEVGAWTRLV